MAIGTELLVGGMNNINNINNISFKAEPLTKGIGAEVSGSFDNIFKAALDTLQNVNDYQVAAEKLQTDFASGKTDDMLAVMVAQEKAYFALNFTVQVTNRVIESYKEIMRIQM